MQVLGNELVRVWMIPDRRAFADDDVREFCNQQFEDENRVFRPHENLCTVYLELLFYQHGADGLHGFPKLGDNRICDILRRLEGECEECGFSPLQNRGELGFRDRGWCIRNEVTASRLFAVVTGKFDELRKPRRRQRGCNISALVRRIDDD